MKFNKIVQLSNLNNIDNYFSDELGIDDENEAHSCLSENEKNETEPKMETSKDQTDQSEKRFLRNQNKVLYTHYYT